MAIIPKRYPLARHLLANSQLHYQAVCKREVKVLDIDTEMGEGSRWCSMLHKQLRLTEEYILRLAKWEKASWKVCPQKNSSSDHLDCPDLSNIERDSFLKRLQCDYGNPLHSTAMEDPNVPEGIFENTGKERNDNAPQEQSRARKSQRTAVKRKQQERSDTDDEKQRMKRNPRVRGKASWPEKRKKGAPDVDRGEADAVQSSDPHPTSTASGLRHLVGKKPAKRSAGWRSVKTPQKRAGESDKGKSSGSASQEDSDSSSAQSQKQVLSSDEEGQEDVSWVSSPKKSKVYNLVMPMTSSLKSRKSLSVKGPAEPQKATVNQQRRERRGRQGGTELEVVLDAFLDFCDQYRESVEPTGIRQSIDSFAAHVKEQLLEKISACKELRALKRENAKVTSLIRIKQKRLLDAKNELNNAEKQVSLLEKEAAMLKLRLADLRRGSTFLRDIRELTRQYLEYRHVHPKEKETYGATSLPALMLEAKHILEAEHQLKGINIKLEKRLKQSGN
ncbi:centromere protein U [Thalassophryne amazonica]|uniref:centromere protein U n=1 Tax=Thalassophryne amazonica TaxID=390379 RepID=UPI0014721B0E|nr:centromere protein U [Thalassophryne amazonica]